MPHPRPISTVALTLALLLPGGAGAHDPGRGIRSTLAQADSAYQRGDYAIVVDTLGHLFDAHSGSIPDGAFPTAAGLLADSYWQMGDYNALLRHSERHQPDNVTAFWGCLVREAGGDRGGRACWRRQGESERVLRTIRSEVIGDFNRRGR